MFAETLHRLSTLAVHAPPAAESLCRAAEILWEGSGGREAHIIYVPAEEFCWASGPSSVAKPIDDGGLRHVQRRLPPAGAPLAFDVDSGGRIEGLVAVAEARDRQWLALPFPGRGNYADMLLVRGPWSGADPDEALRLLEASLPALTVLIGRLLDASQASHQRQQLNALSEVARAITQTRDMEAVLTPLATTIAAVTGYEYAILDVLAEDGRRLRYRCQNQSRWSESPQARFWSEVGLAQELDPLYLHVAGTGEPALLVDMQHDERVSPGMREFFRASLLVSAAVLPLLFQDEVLGFLSVTSPRPLDFPSDEVQLLQGLAAQAAAAIKAIQNYEELEASREQLEEYAERLREAVEIQHRLARTDALTGLANRRYVEEFLAAQCARTQREGSPLAVVLADVDDFKKINDTFGHGRGDQVLIELANLSQATCRSMDLVGRYGGDEFVFVLPTAGLQDAASFAQRVRGRVARRRRRLGNGTVSRVTLSLGVSEFSRQRVDPDAILQSADEALYRAKALGKDRVCLAEDRVRAA